MDDREFEALQLSADLLPDLVQGASARAGTSRLWDLVGRSQHRKVIRISLAPSSPLLAWLAFADRLDRAGGTRGLCSTLRVLEEFCVEEMALLRMLSLPRSGWTLLAGLAEDHALVDLDGVLETRDAYLLLGNQSLQLLRIIGEIHRLLLHPCHVCLDEGRA